MSNLLDRLVSHLNEDEDSHKCKMESIIRKLLAEEENATSKYLKAAHKLAEKAEEYQDKTAMRIAKVFHDIAKEEKVHIGELQKCLELIGVSQEPIQQGKNEVEEIVGNVGEV